MKFTLLIATLLSLNAFAGNEFKRIAPQFRLISSEKQMDLSNSEAIYKFKIKNVSDDIPSIGIHYSIDGVKSRVNLKDYTFEVKTTHGKHIFQIYIGSNYEELYSDSLFITGGNKNTYHVYVRSNYQIIETVDKPVIYLYPEIEQEVEVKVYPVGEMFFTYPEYNEGWNVIATPEGTIKHNGEDYNYLFWESIQTTKVETLAQNGGYIVEKNNVLSFLEHKLNKAGFTSKEKADFITYWAPRLIQFDAILIEFIQDTECDQFATLYIFPKPDNTNRFYMSWSKYQGGVVAEPREIHKMNRSGFDILEWGGQQLNSDKISEAL